MSKLDILTADVSMSLMYNKAVVFMMTERLDEAETCLRNVAAHFSERIPDGYNLKNNERKGLYLRIMNDMGEVYVRKGPVSEASTIFHDIYDSRKGWQGGLPTFLSLKLNMGRALTKLGRFAEARKLLFEVIAVYTEWWGWHHLETMGGIDELAWTFMKEGKEKQARNGTGEI